ncbi:MAG: ferredoxin-type protein NapF [Epsilonproteobacteria bacterium]|nr:ferredoxin-type protein NapF [Campylobacterota bacterium]
MADSGRRRLFASLSAPFKEAPKLPNPIRPPYASDPSLFQTLCVECRDKPCVSACEESIIEPDAKGIPKLVFTQKGCTFCEACADACPAGVLSDKSLNFLDATVEIDILKCMAWHQVMCHSCKEPCLEDAIAFLGLFRPSIDPMRCTACGWCLSVCPSDAITIVQGKKDQPCDS